MGLIVISTIALVILAIAGETALHHIDVGLAAMILYGIYASSVIAAFVLVNYVFSC